MKQIRSRLTYANVMASIAVFLVIGGGAAFAALGKNTVGTKQLKKNAVTTAKIKKNAVATAKIKSNAVTTAKIKNDTVTTAKIKNDAVTGDKVNEGTLGTVPTANFANSIPAAEATHLVGAPGEPGFEGGSTNLPSGSPLLGYNPVGFYKDHEGIVHLQGIAQAGPEGIVFTLPPGYRPASNKLLILSPLEESTVLILGSNIAEGGFDLSGKVLGEGGEPVVLDNITYRAES